MSAIAAAAEQVCDQLELELFGAQLLGWDDGRTATFLDLTVADVVAPREAAYEKLRDDAAPTLGRPRRGGTPRRLVAATASSVSAGLGSGRPPIRRAATARAEPGAVEASPPPAPPSSWPPG